MRHKPTVIRHLHTDWPIVRTLEGERNPDVYPAALATWVVAVVGGVVLFVTAVYGGLR